MLLIPFLISIEISFLVKRSAAVETRLYKSDKILILHLYW